MKLLTLAALLLCGCQRQPEAPLYFIQRTTEHLDGTTEVWVYSGPTPPSVPVDGM